MSKEGTIYTVIFVFIVSFVFVLFLSLTNGATISMVELNQEVARQGAVLTAMGIEATEPEEVQAKYETVSADTAAGLYVADVDGRTVYAIQFAGAGLWGTISGVLAVTSDFSEIVGLEIVSDNETPGLGGRINEAAFKDQFRGVQVPATGIRVVQNRAEGTTGQAGIVDGVTGASRTSESIQTIVNGTLQDLRTPQNQGILRSLEAEGGTT